MEVKDFFHGQLSMSETLRIMDKNPPGSFLVRKEISGQLILTCRISPRKISHFHLPTIGCPFLENRLHLQTVKALVNHISYNMNILKNFIPPESSDPIPEPNIPFYLPRRSKSSRDYNFPKGFCFVCEKIIPGETVHLAKHFRLHQLSECPDCETVMIRWQWDFHKKEKGCHKLAKAECQKSEPFQERTKEYVNVCTDKQLLSPTEGPVFDHDYGYGKLDLNMIDEAKDATPAPVTNLPVIKFALPEKDNDTSCEILDDCVESFQCLTKVKGKVTLKKGGSSIKPTVSEDLILRMLSLSQEPNYQDVQILCENGVFETNSFVLASIFPLFKDLLKTANHEEPFVISMPDMDKDLMKQLFYALANQYEEIFVPSVLWNYLSSTMKDQLKEISQREEINESENTSVLKRLVGVNSNDVKILVQPKILKKNNFVSPIEPKVLKKNYVKPGEPKIETPKVFSKTGTTNPQRFNPQGLFKLHGVGGEIDELSGNFVQDVPFEVVEHSSVGPDNQEKIFNLNKCIFCLNEFNSWEELKVHEVSHPRFGTKFNCLICNHQCGRTLLKDHYLKKHLRPDDFVKCPKCKRSFLKTKLERHLGESCNGLKPSRLKPKTSDQKVELCTECGESVKNINYHMNYHHSGLKVGACKICGKYFSNRSRLLAHINKTHKSKQPCPECGVLVRNMKLHSMTAHVPDSEKKHQCQDCGKGFLNRAALEKHRMNMHLKTRPYHCRYGCSNAYNDTSNRNAHERKTHGQLFGSN